MSEEPLTREEEPPGRVGGGAECKWADCTEKANRTGYCFKHMQKGRAQEKAGEPKAKAPPSAPRARASGTSLERELREVYTMVAGGITLADADLGGWTASRAASMAHAHAELAKQNRNVERFLRKMIEGGAATYAVMETGLWAFGMYSIAMLKRGTLSPNAANAAVMFGVPLVPINERLQRERTIQPDEEQAA